MIDAVTLRQSQHMRERPVERKIPVEIRRVTLFSQIARAACTVLLVCMSAVFIALCLGIAFGRGGDGKLNLGLYAINAGQVTTPAVRIWSMLFIAILFAPFFKGALHLRALFANFVSSEIYTQENVRHLRQLGLLALAIPVLAGVLMAVSWVLVQQGVIDKSLVTHDRPSINLLSALSYFVTPLLLVLASWIMEVGRKTRSEADDMRREAELTI